MAKYQTNLTPKMIENASLRSYEGFMNINIDVDAVLGGPSGSPTLYSYNHGQCTAYKNAYNGWKIQVAKQKADTAVLTAKLKELPGEAYGWCHTIEGVYKKGTPEYIALLPHGRSIFGKGSQTARIAAVTQLSSSLTGIASLASVKTSVDAFLADLNAANAAQKASIGTTKVKLQILEENRKNSVDSLIYVLAGLMQEFNNDVQKVNEYFPMHLLRPTPQTLFTGSLSAEAYKVIVKRTYKAGAFVTLKNTGTVVIEYYLAETNDGVIPPNFIPLTVGAGVTVKVPIEQLGSIANKYLTVRNTTREAAKWEVTVPA